MQNFVDVTELVDPRPFGGARFTYQGMPLLPVSYDCDWMVSNKVLLSAVGDQVFDLAFEA